MTDSVRTLPPELTRLLQPYDAGVQELFAVARGAILREPPGAHELVYDSYNAVAAAYSFTGKLRDAFCHVAAYSRHVNLGFNRGAELPDPDGILAGAGKLIRHVRVTHPSAVTQEAVLSLIRSAVASAPAGESNAGGAVVLKSSAPRKRRPAR